jgi:hypothetical protein
VVVVRWLGVEACSGAESGCVWLVAVEAGDDSALGCFSIGLPFRESMACCQGGGDTQGMISRCAGGGDGGGNMGDAGQASRARDIHPDVLSRETGRQLALASVRHVAARLLSRDLATHLWLTAVRRHFCESSVTHPPE